MTGSTPPVTVLMAVHNGEAFVDRAISSILSQTFADFEFLIVDDGSSDGTAARIAAYRDPRIRIITHATNVGLTKSLNHGLSLARGALIARQDADDVSHRTRLHAQVSFLDAHPDVAVVGTQARIVDAKDRPLNVPAWPKSTSSEAIRWQLLFDSPFFHTSVMFRTRLVRDLLNGYDERFRTSQDFELWSRVAAARHEMANLADVLVDFRVHPASASSGYDAETVGRIGSVVRTNLTTLLGPDAVPRGWPEAWIRMTNPRVFSDAPDSSRPAAAAIDEIFQRFAARFPGAARNREIRRHTAAMLIRTANAGAERGTLRSLGSLLRAAHFDLPLTVAGAPRYFALLALRRHRHRRIPRDTPPPQRPCGNDERS